MSFLEMFTHRYASSPVIYLYLGLLYFLEGVPYGMQDKLLPQYLRSENFSYGKVALARVLLIPWICKPLYASYIEQSWTQKRWLQTFLALLIAVTCSASFLDQSTPVLVAVLLVVNIVSASLDITVDSVAMDLLRGSQLAMGNAVQVGAYKAGAIFGGGVLLLLQVAFGLKGALQGLCAIYALGLVVVTLKDNEKNMKQDGKTDSMHKANSRRNSQTVRRRNRSGDHLLDSEDDLTEMKSCGVLQRLRLATSVEGTWGLFAFLVLYKSGESLRV